MLVAPSDDVTASTNPPLLGQEGAVGNELGLNSEGS